MASPLADLLFFLVAAAIVVSQLFILRSTARGMRYADSHPAPGAGAAAAPRRGALEWTYAIVPAIALALLLFFSWRAMHPSTVRVEGIAPRIGTDS